MTQPVLVTGGCGFIGSNFIRYLLETDPEARVVNLDALTYAGNPANVADFADDRRYCFIQGDITDREAVHRAIGAGVRGIINFAAESHVDRSIRDRRPFILTNVVGTQVLLDAALEFNVPRFLQVSTDEVYGSLGPTGSFTEERPPAPSSPYAATKAAADLLVMSYARTFGIPAVISRCSNNYGPYQHPEKLVPLAIARLLRDEPIPIYGDGLQVRDWIHVRDHCRAIDLVWREGRAGEVYNIGGRSERTNLEVCHALLKAMGRPASLLRHDQDRPGHDRRYAVDCSKIENELGWRRQTAFEEGLKETVAWYCENQAWIEAVRSGASGASECKRRSRARRPRTAVVSN